MDGNDTFDGMLILVQVANVDFDFSLGLEHLRFGPENIKFVQYPDCQQLIIWLPAHYQTYANIQIIDSGSGEIFMDDKIENVVSGSIQILINAMKIPNGSWKIRIFCNSGGYHEIAISKGQLGDRTAHHEAWVPEAELHTEAIVYRDGFGVEIPNFDLELRQKTIERTIDKVFRTVSFINKGKEGEVVYAEGNRTIRFFVELGGGAVLFYINIPSVSDWEKATGFELDRRSEIIEFVASETLKHQAPTSTFTIDDDTILYKNSMFNL